MKTHTLPIVLAIVLSCTRAVPAADTVRIEVTNGAPRIVVDGQAVRARMFFGLPGSRPLKVSQQGQEFCFEFTPVEDEAGGGTMHFRFSQIPGDIYIDDLQVTDLTAHADAVPLHDFEQDDAFVRNWTIWPPPPQNTVGEISVVAGTGQNGSQGLQIQLKNPATGNWPDFHFYHRPDLTLHKGHRYQVKLWARAVPERSVTIAFYRPGRVYTYLGGSPGCFESQIKLAADVDVDFVSFPVHMPWPQPDTQVDWTVVDRQIETVLHANPRALLLPRIGMGAPLWWKEAHSDAVMVWDQGSQQHSDVVVASPDYLHDAAEQLHALVAYLEQKYGEHMAGYHPCGQNTGEWFYQETWGPALSGYSNESLRAWRRWLRQTYADDVQLRRAWHDESATIDAAVVPTPAARYAAPGGIFRDPVSERPLIDFAQFQQEMMANCVCHFAKTVRRASQGKRLVVFFYGYVHEFGAIRNGPAISGHYALRRVLDCPDIDVLCSPISYFDRGLGQSGPAMTAAESVALAGKMWLYEDDTRTYLAAGSTFPGWQDGVDTVEETRALLVRNTAQCALRNFGTWWMDLGATGWFDDPRMWHEMDRLKTLDQALLRSPRPFCPEVAVVIDETSMLRVAAGGDAVTRPGVYEIRRPLGRCGAPYGQYLLSDVLAGKVKAKLYVLANSWCLSPRQRQDLLRETEGAVKIWCYAPGYQEPDGKSLDAMHELTGFRIEPISVPEALARPTETARRLGVQEELGVRAAIQPLFAVADAEPDETLASYSDGQCAVAVRDSDRGASFFVGPPGLTSELLRLAARRAGVHLFTDTDCNVYANGPYLLLHASQDGPIGIDSGRRGSVRDMLTGEMVGEGPEMTLELKRGDSRLLTTASKAD